MAVNRPTKLTIELPEEVFLALHRKPEEFEKEARMLLAMKLYEDERLTTGLAARLAGIPRGAFIVLMGQYGLTPFGYEPEDLDQDLEDARRA